MTSTTKITHFKAAEEWTLERNSRVERSVSRAVFQYAAGAVVVLLLASLGWAQKDMGTIVGSVKDSSGALVADAKVMVAARGGYNARSAAPGAREELRWTSDSRAGR